MIPVFSSVSVSPLWSVSLIHSSLWHTHHTHTHSLFIHTLLARTHPLTITLIHSTPAVFHHSSLYSIYLFTCFHFLLISVPTSSTPFPIFLCRIIVNVSYVTELTWENLVLTCLVLSSLSLVLVHVYLEATRCLDCLMLKLFSAQLLCIWRRETDPKPSFDLMLPNAELYVEYLYGTVLQLIH